jgi:hypothetical protein
MQQIECRNQNKKAPGLGRFLICNNVRVRQVDYRWNHLVPALYLMHAKLELFGLVYMHNKVLYLHDRELGRNTDSNFREQG